MNNTYIVANWKMNGDHVFNRDLISTIDDNTVINDTSHMIILPFNAVSSANKQSKTILYDSGCSEYLSI